MEQPRFSCLSKLGNGAYADVFAAVDSKFNGRKVAIKCYQSDTTRTMGVCGLVIREIGILMKLNHPHIVQALDIVIASNNKIFLVMELVDTVTPFHTLLSHSASLICLSPFLLIYLYTSESF